MTENVTLSEDRSCLKIKGALNVETVMGLREQSVPLLKIMPEPLIDLQAVTICDSSALALLTALARDAKKLGKTICFAHLPPALLAIIQLSDLDKVLPLRS